MKSTEEKKASQKAAVAKYQENRDAIMLRPPKAEGEAIRAAAALAGSSVQAYILEAVRERMNKAEQP